MFGALELPLENVILRSGHEDTSEGTDGATAFLRPFRKLAAETTYHVYGSQFGSWWRGRGHVRAHVSALGSEASAFLAFPLGSSSCPEDR